MDEPRDSQDGFCPIHDTYLDDGYCVACLVNRVGDLERALVEEKAEKLWYAIRMGRGEPLGWHDTNDGTRDLYRIDARITLRAKGLLPKLEQQ